MDDIAERFWKNVDKQGPDDCWEWQSNRSDKGYGLFLLSRQKKIKSHRMVWMLVNDYIPDGLGVLHTCDNPPCCNPAHLFLGSNQDNVDDRIKKGRTPHGETHCRAKLTDREVYEIRDRSAAGNVTRQSLAVEYGISASHVSRIILSKTRRPN